MDDQEKLKGDVSIPLPKLLKRILQYIKPEKKNFIIAFVLICLNVAFDVIGPLFTSEVTEQLTLSNINIKHILTVVLAAFLVTLFNQAFLYIEAMILNKTGQRIIYRLRMEVFEHIENMSQDQFSEMPTGSLVTRVASYTAQLSDLFTQVLVKILRNSFTVIGAFCIMLWMSPQLALVLSCFVVVVFIVSLIFSKVATRIFRKERRLISDLNTFLSENLSGMKLIQIFNQEETKEAEFLTKSNALFAERYNVSKAFGLYRPFISFLYYSSIAAIFYFGVKIKLSPGDVVAFYLMLGRFFNPIQELADQLNNLQKALTSCERLFNLLDVQPHVINKQDDIEIDHFKGKIEFKHVWFAYNQENWILKDVSFLINPNETCAFVGATGAGKTTILSLIVRNYEIQKGQILIDDIDITHIKIESLRKCIGQMLQDVFMFSGDIRTNITLHDDSFTDEEINEVCKYVNADYFIKQLPNGLSEEVIERGENFSQGQRQLLSFARTILTKPQILILDEATANIDTETEVVIQSSLEKMKNIGTMLVVAHRLSTIQHADQIIVLHNGEIVEKGNHQQLLKNKKQYYKLYQLQFKD